MPTIVTSNPCAVQFDVRPTFNKFLLADINGVGGIYVIDGIPASGVKGNFTITAPDGTVIYNNTSFASPDYVGNVSYLFEAVPIPVNADGTYVHGIYTVVMRTQIIDGSNPTYVLTFTGTYDFQYTHPVVSILQTIDCVSPLFTSVDQTNYGLATATSSTVTRTHTIVYPPGSAGDGSPVVGTSTTLTTGTFYNGPQTTEISTALLYNIPTLSGTATVANYQVRDVVTGVKYVTVDCSFICNIYCCLRTLYNTAQGYKGNNNVLYQKYTELFAQCMSIVELALLSIECGKSTETSAYIQQVQLLANCTNDCCGSDTPSLVTGLGGSGVNVVVASGGAPVQVSSSTVGSTTTYTVTLSSAFVSLVNSSYNTTVTSTDGSVTIVQTGTNPINYDLSFGGLQNRLEFNCTITGANTTINNPGKITIAISDVYISGTKFKTPTINCAFTSNPNWNSAPSIFEIKDFYISSPTDNYKVTFSDSTEKTNAGVTTGNQLNILQMGASTLSTRIWGRQITLPGQFYMSFFGSSHLSSAQNMWLNCTMKFSFVITD